MRNRISKYGFHTLAAEGDSIEIAINGYDDAQRLRAAAHSYGRNHGLRLRVSVSGSSAKVSLAYRTEGGKPKERSLPKSATKWNLSPHTRFSDINPGQTLVVRDVSEAEAQDYQQAVRLYAKDRGWKVQTKRLIGGGVKIHRRP